MLGILGAGGIRDEYLAIVGGAPVGALEHNFDGALHRLLLGANLLARDELAFVIDVEQGADAQGVANEAGNGGHAPATHEIG